MLWTFVIFAQAGADDPVVNSGAAVPEQQAMAAGAAMLEARGLPLEVLERWRRAPAGAVLRASTYTFGLVRTPVPAQAGGPIGEWVAEHMW
ncbi:hypothetical protein [Tsukamurella strandjordii]|uniref:hypothetical protein n=1 Tax=Tsukamurella strandjordii TaxID=147577 RepID=UPI0031D89B2D